jgi:hypothetical protein
MKGVHPLYQDQMVFNFSLIVVIPISQNHYFFMFTLLAFLMGSYQSLVTFLLISKGQKQAPSSPSLAKPPKPLKNKFVTKPPLKN